MILHENIHLSAYLNVNNCCIVLSRFAFSSTEPVIFTTWQKNVFITFIL